MNIFQRLFDHSRAPLTQKVSSDEISPEASKLISEALEIIENNISSSQGIVTVTGSGSEGIIMNAAHLFEQAHLLHPQNALLHYTWASALQVAAQYKTAEEVMKEVLHEHPNYILAKFALQGWKLWKSQFRYPQMEKGAQKIHQAIADQVITCVLVIVREGILPRVALFQRDSNNDFQNIAALKAARIDLTTLISSINDPQVVAVCGKIWDDPKNPLDTEALELPFRPMGDSTRHKYELLCTQKDIDFLIIDRQNKVLLNRRIQMSKNMLTVNARLLKMLETIPGRDYSDSELVTAIKRHQEIFKPWDVHY